MLLSPILFIASTTALVPPIVWEHGGYLQSQVSRDGNSILATTRFEGSHWKFDRINIATGAVTAEPGRTHFDNLRVNNRLIDFHGQMLELLFSSSNSAILTKWGSLYRVGPDERLQTWTAKIGGFNNTLHGDPDHGPFVLEWQQGEPHYDWVQMCQVVLPNFRVLRTNYHKCLDVGPDGVLVEKILQPKQTGEFNFGDRSVTYLDPVHGKERWKVKGVDSAVFWGGFVVCHRKNLEFRSIQTGRLQARPSYFRGDWRIERVSGDCLILKKTVPDGPETLRCVRAPSSPRMTMAAPDTGIVSPHKAAVSFVGGRNATARKLWTEAGTPELAAPGPSANSVFLLIGNAWELRDLATGAGLPFGRAQEPQFNSALTRYAQVRNEKGTVIWHSGQTKILQMSQRRFAIVDGESSAVFSEPARFTEHFGDFLGEPALGVVGDPNSGAFGLFGTAITWVGPIANAMDLEFLKRDGSLLAPRQMVDTEGAVRELNDVFGEPMDLLTGWSRNHWIDGYLYGEDGDGRGHERAVLRDPQAGKVVQSMPNIDVRSQFVFAQDRYLLLKSQKQLECWQINVPPVPGRG